MSVNSDEYRRQADYCEKMARRADTLDGKAAWLRLASKWLALSEPMRQRTESENFDSMVETRGTRQSDSSSRH